MACDKTMSAFAISAVLALGAQAVEAGAAETHGEGIVRDAVPLSAPTSKDSLPQLDAPVTPEDSVWFDFGYGKILRIPKILLPVSVIPKDSKQPIRANAISMIFWYPDMTRADWVSLRDIIFQKQGGVYVSQKDRFRVNVLYMVYSPGDLRNLPPGKGVLMEPGPEQIERNRHCWKRVEGHCVDQMRRVPSGFPGIDAQIAEDWIAKHPEAAIHDAKKGGSYIAKPESPYELSMDCDNPEHGVECVAHVYSKKHRFQYRMIFAPEAVAHTDQLIHAIDGMIEHWDLK